MNLPDLHRLYVLLGKYEAKATEADLRTDISRVRNSVLTDLDRAREAKEAVRKSWPAVMGDSDPPVDWP